MAVAAEDELAHFLPIHMLFDVEVDPAAVADVARHLEARIVGERRLQFGTNPELHAKAQSPCSVGNEEGALAGLERRRAELRRLDGFRQFGAQRPQADELLLGMRRRERIEHFGIDRFGGRFDGDGLADLLRQRCRRRVDVCLPHPRGDGQPVVAAIQVDAQPALCSNVGRHEVEPLLAFHMQRLGARRRIHPQCDAAVAVVVHGQGGEGLAAHLEIRRQGAEGGILGRA